MKRAWLPITCGGLILASGVANAFQWQSARQLGIGFNVLDNRVHPNEGADPDTESVLTITPGFIFDGVGENSTANVRLGARYTHLTENNLRRFTPNLQLVTSTNPAAGPLTVDGSVSLDTLAVPDTEAAGEVESIAVTHRLEINPRFEQRLGNQVNSQLGYAFLRVGADDDQLQASDEHRIDLQLASTPALEAFAWSIDINSRRIEFDDNTKLRNRYLLVGFGFPVRENWRVNIGVGRELATGPLVGQIVGDGPAVSDEVEPADDDTTASNLWDAGVEWRPSGRTTVSVSYGQRIFARFPSVELEHRTRRSTFTLGLTRSLTRSANFLPVFLSGAGDGLGQPDPGSNPLSAPGIDLPEATPLFNTLTVDETVNLAWQLQGRISSLTAESSFSTRENRADSTSVDTYQAIIAFERELSSQWEWRADYQFTSTDGPDTRQDIDSNRIGLSLRYQSRRF